MWLFCKSGFFSAVEHNSKPGVIHVRARFKGDLERLCERHGLKPLVETTPYNDYAYRMDFQRDVWAKIVSDEALDIDYPNFKNAVHDGTQRDFAYMGCWSSLRSGKERQMTQQ